MGLKKKTPLTGCPYLTADSSVANLGCPGPVYLWDEFKESNNAEMAFLLRLQIPYRHSKTSCGIFGPQRRCMMTSAMPSMWLLWKLVKQIRLWKQHGYLTVVHHLQDLCPHSFEQTCCMPRKGISQKHSVAISQYSKHDICCRQIQKKWAE